MDLYFAPLGSSGLLAPEADVDAAVTRGAEQELFAVCETYAARRVFRRGAEETDSQHQELFANKLNDSAEVTPLQALRANRSLVDHLMQRRLDAIRDAREAGVSWADIGAALGVSRQAAHELYHRHKSSVASAAAPHHPRARS